jgi:hypothetical protein
MPGWFAAVSGGHTVKQATGKAAQCGGTALMR